VLLLLPQKVLHVAFNLKVQEKESSAFCLLLPLPSNFSAKSSLPELLPNRSGNNSLTVAPVPLMVNPWSVPSLRARPRMLSAPELAAAGAGRGVILSASVAVFNVNIGT
jgi:hypothetical protein